MIAWHQRLALKNWFYRVLCKRGIHDVVIIQDIFYDYGCRRCGRKFTDERKPHEFW